MGRLWRWSHGEEQLFMFCVRDYYYSSRVLEVVRVKLTNKLFVCSFMPLSACHGGGILGGGVI